MRRIVKRLAGGLLGLLLLGSVLFVASIAWDARFGAKVEDVANTELAGPDGQPVLAYLARPDGPGPHPGVLLIHEWWGLIEGIGVLADALAAEGYVVLAPDAYRGRVTDRVSRALWLRLGTPEAQVRADLDAALDHLRSLDGVDGDRIASMGFCFGGGHSLQLGLRRSESLALTVMYYGAVVTEPELLRPLTEGKGVLGIFAEEDQTIFPEDVLEFEAALNSLDIPNEIMIYPGVGHAFLNEDNYLEPGPAGEAWTQTLDFLERSFGG